MRFDLIGKQSGVDLVASLEDSRSVPTLFMKILYMLVMLLVKGTNSDARCMMHTFHVSLIRYSQKRYF